jgi:WD40 repeat protein
MGVSRKGMLAVGDTKGYLTLIDCQSREVSSYYTHHSNKILSLAFTNDGEYLGTLGQDKVISLTNTANHSLKRQLKGKIIFSLLQILMESQLQIASLWSAMETHAR